MKGFFARHRKLHLWLLAELCLLAAFFLTRSHRAWMNALAEKGTGPLRRRIGDLCYRTDVSVMEVLCCALTAFAALYLIFSALAVIRGRGRRKSRLYTALMGLFCVGLTIYGGFCLLWGVNYYTDSFQDLSGIRAEEVSVDDLTAVTQLFADGLARTADKVPRNGDGLFSVPRSEILAESPEAYSALAVRFPFLAFSDRPPKAVHFSRVMSRLDFTGVYCPFTGESNVNMDSPACLLPSTAAHELAHQRGISSEQECNFLAILACTTCGRDDYAYSGWLLGYIYLGNALHGADTDRWQKIYDALPETAKADLSDNNAYWAQFRSGTTRKVSNKVYDSFLKSYGESKGLQSYGTVVDLLVAYYQK